MRKNTIFFKRICAMTVSAALMMGTPLLSYALDTDVEADSEIAMNEESEPDAEADSEITLNEESEPDAEAALETETSSDTETTPDTNADVDTSVPIVTSTTDETNENAEPDSSETEEAVVSEEVSDESSEESSHSTGLLMLDPDPTDDITVEDSAEGSGSLLITTMKRPKNVVSVVVPVLDSYSYDFVLDPEDLLSLDNRNNIIGEGGTVYFKQKDAENTYSIYSDIVTAVNKSTVPVNMRIDLALMKDEEVPLTFTDLGETFVSKEPVLSFAIVPTEYGTVKGGEAAENTTPIKSQMTVTDENGFATKELVLPGVIDNFDIVTKPTEDPLYYTQEYVVKEDSEWPIVGFALYGSCSRDADWSEVAAALYKGKRLSLTLTYRLTPILDEEPDGTNEDN